MLLTVACSKGNKSSADGEVKRDKRVPVELEVITTGDIAAYVKASANLETEYQVRVISRTSNLLAELLVEEGDQVAAGDLLARLENDSQRIALDKAKAKFARDQREYDRQKNLVKKNLISEQDFAKTSFEYDQAKLDRDKAQIDFDYTEIRAPIAGTVTSRLVNLGDQVTNNKHLFDIVDFDSMIAKIYLPEEHIPDIRVGQIANIQSQAISEQTFSGKVKRVAPVVDAKTGTVKVTVAVNPENVLLPGMYVDVSLLMKTQSNAVLVPKKALVYDNNQAFVYVYGRNNAVKRIAIEAEIADTDNIKPISGVSPGDRVVIAGHRGLKDGARVRVLNESPEYAQEDEPIKKQPLQGAPEAERL